MENQVFGMFSKELEKQIIDTVTKVIMSTAADTKVNSGKRYFKKKDFCTEVCISYNTLSAWIDNGLKVIQIDGISLIDMQDAVQFLNKHKI
ncbi:hypothetical protein [Carnobacterium funditum]|uniref:hypothetical protein n=1 Tax=Carnobacterium funditum TaxID=2752 RepID=UPI0005563543|nr:hypothetical protein [Carnobacterium funditum]